MGVDGSLFFLLVPSSWSLVAPQTVATFPVEQLSHPELVECNAELLLVGYANEYSQVVVFRVADLIRGVPAVPLMSIGDQALFIGGSNMAVNSKNLPSILGNSIAILTDICGGIVGRGTLPLYDLGSGTWSQVFDGHFLDGPIPRPYSLALHIATCCKRLFWNSGDVFCCKPDGH
jgi:hypothetical protein